MAELRVHKVVSALPSTLEPDSLYLVRTAAGFDLYVTNHSGTVVSYPANYQAKHQNLSALAGLTGAANKMFYFTSASEIALADLTVFGRQLIASADAPAARSALGLGTAAVRNVGTGGFDLVENQALGTAARKNVTTSATDVTPDRVLRTGDGGWMGDVPTQSINFNLDDRTLRGWRYVGIGATTGTFPPGVRYGHVNTFGNTGDAIGQELWAFEGDSRTYTRWYRQCFGTAAWGEWTVIPRQGDPLQGSTLVECGTFLSGSIESDILIKTNIPASESIMPSLVIEGAISGYTVPFRIDLSWYYYQGAIYLPVAMAISAGSKPGWMAIHLSVLNGMIQIRLRFTVGSVYLPRVVIRGLRTGIYGGPLSYYLGWTAAYSAGAQAGEVLVSMTNQLKDSDIERGINANGSYTRYPDGTMEVWKAISVVVPANTLTQVNTDLPAAIDLSQPAIPVLGLGGPTNTWGFECRQLAATVQSSTRIMVSMMCTVAQTYTVFLKVTGRWK